MYRKPPNKLLCFVIVMCNSVVMLPETLTHPLLLDIWDLSGTESTE